MESEENKNDIEQQSTIPTVQIDQTLESENANPKIQELIKLVKDMHDQNSSGQLSSELCMQIFVIIEELTPLFNEKLKVDMGKCLEKIRKALRKDKFESKDQDSSKGKGSFKTLFKSSKNGLCYEAIDGYFTVLITKTNESHGFLWEELKVLPSTVPEQNNVKKSLKKEKSPKSKNSELLDQPLPKENLVEEPVISQSSADDLHQIESSLAAKSEVDLDKLSLNDDKPTKNDITPENCQHLSDTQSIDKDDASFDVQVSTKEQSTEGKLFDPLSKQHEATPEPLEASTEQSLGTKLTTVDDPLKNEELPSNEEQKERLCDDSELLLIQKPLTEEPKSSEMKEEQQKEVKKDTLLTEHTSIDPLATTDDKSSEDNQSTELEPPSSKDKTLVKRKTSFRDKFFKKKQPSLNKQLSIDEQESKYIEPTLETQVSLEKVSSSEEQPGETQILSENQSEESVKKSTDKKSKKAEKASKKNKQSSTKESTVEEQDQPSGNDSITKDQTSIQKKSLFKKQLSKEEQLKLPELITYEEAVPKIQEFIKLITDMLEQNTFGQINPELCSQIYTLLEELTPFFNDRLNIDLDKHLLKMKKALKKINVDLDLPETLKRKQIFQTFFKYTKSGIFFGATMLYVRTLISKFNENPGELSDILGSLADILSLKDKKDAEKENAAEDDKKSQLEDDSEDKQTSNAEKEPKITSDSKKEQSVKREDNLNTDQSIEDQTTGTESLTNEEAISKIQELIKLATEMFEQNKFGQVEPELCTQMYVILQELTPYFFEKLNIDLDKYLSKMKKSLKKDMFELDLPDSSKRKQVFTAIFRYSKSGLFFGTATLYIRKLIAKADETPGELSDALKPLSEIVSIENITASIKSKEVVEDEKKKDTPKDENQLKKTKTSKTSKRLKSTKILEQDKNKDEQMEHTVELPEAPLNLIVPNKVAEDIEVSANETLEHNSETQKCFNQTENNESLDNSELTEMDVADQSGLKSERVEELATENEEGEQPSVDEDGSKDKEESKAHQEESGPKEEDNDIEDNDSNETKTSIEKRANENIDNNSEEEQSNDKNEDPELTDQTKSNQKEQSDDENQDSRLTLAQITPKLSKFKQMFTKPKPQQQSKPKSQTKKSGNDQKDRKSEEVQKVCNPIEGSDGNNKAQDNSDVSGGINRFGDTTNLNDDELNEVDNDGSSMGLGAHRSGLNTEGNEESIKENNEQDQSSEIEDEEGSNVDEEESETEEEDDEDDSDETEDSDDEFDSDMENLLDDFDSDNDDEEGKGHKVMSILIKIAKKALNVALDLDI